MPIIGSWDEIDIDMARPLETRQLPARRPSSIGTPAPSTFTSITAARWFHFDAKNDQEQTRFAIRRSGTLVDTRQVSQEFRLTASPSDEARLPGGRCICSTSRRTRASRNLYGADAGAFFATQLAIRGAQHDANRRRCCKRRCDDVLQTTFQNPVSDSVAVFGQVNWHAHRSGDADARPAPHVGIQDQRHREVGIVRRRFAARVDRQRDGRRDPRGAARRVFGDGAGPADRGRARFAGWSIRATSLTDDVLLYASASAGEKSGAVAFEQQRLARERRAGEDPLNFEIGVKSVFCAIAGVMLNVNLYYTRVEDYQDVTSEPDPTSPTGFSSRARQHPGDPRARRRSSTRAST